MLRKIVVVSLGLCTIAFVLYFYTLRALATRGNALFEYRCLHVNPPLIAYKNAFLKYADFLNTYPQPKYTDEEVKGFVADYIAGMRGYVPLEDKWLGMQKEFMDGQMYRLIEPWYIQEAGILQWNMYQAYKDDATDMLFTFDNPQDQKNIQPGYVSEIRQRRDDAIKKYFEFFKQAVKIRDWRKFFATVAIPKGCTQENMEILDTTGSIDWNRDPNGATPSAIPIDPYGAS